MLENREMGSVGRYETFIATFIGLCALCVAGYTAYMQRQQVRAQVWPILEYDTSNGPDIHFTLANKGVGPAIIKHVIVKVDNQPVRNWIEVLNKIVGPEFFGPDQMPKYSESDMNGHVFSAGEDMTILTPFDRDGNPIKFNRDDPLWVKVNKERFRVSVEICYCSTLGECWTLRASGSVPSTTTECRGCPKASAESFEQ